MKSIEFLDKNYFVQQIPDDFRKLCTIKSYNGTIIIKHRPNKHIDYLDFSLKDYNIVVAVRMSDLNNTNEILDEQIFYARKIANVPLSWEWKEATVLDKSGHQMTALKNQFIIGQETKDIFSIIETILWKIDPCRVKEDAYYVIFLGKE